MKHSVLHPNYLRERIRICEESLGGRLAETLKYGSSLKLIHDRRAIKPVQIWYLTILLGNSKDHFFIFFVLHLSLNYELLPAVCVNMSNERQLSDVSEDVYPLYPFDNEKTNRCFVSWPMLFNDVLDPELLNNALSRLLGMKEWCKLGGRLRLKVRCVLS